MALRMQRWVSGSVSTLTIGTFVEQKWKRSTKRSSLISRSPRLTSAGPASRQQSSQTPRLDSTMYRQPPGPSIVPGEGEQGRMMRQDMFTGKSEIRVSDRLPAWGRSDLSDLRDLNLLANSSA